MHMMQHSRCPHTLPGRNSSGAFCLLELPVTLTADSAAVASADNCSARLLGPAVLLRAQPLLWVLLIKVLLLLLWLLLDFVYEHVEPPSVGVTTVEKMMHLLQQRSAA